MRILFLNDDFPPESFGGAGIVAANLAGEMRKRGHEVHVITSVQERSKAGETVADGVIVHRIYSRYPAFLRWYVSVYNPVAVGAVKALIARIKPDVVHAHNIHGHLSYHCLKLAKRSGVPVLLTAHDLLMVHYGKFFYGREKGAERKITALDRMRSAGKRYNPLRMLAIRHYMNHVDTVIAVSDAVKRVLEANGIQNVAVVHNGINVDEWEHRAAANDRFSNMHDLRGNKVILLSGRLSPAKGAYQALLALKNVLGRVQNAVLLVAGATDSYSPAMKEIAENAGIADKVVLTGWLGRESIASAYAAADVVIVPSLYLDPFPTVNLEAMASRKPVVGTCFGGTPEIVVDGETGFIVDPADTEALAEKIAVLLEDEGKAKRFGEAGYDRVKEQFSLRGSADEVIRLYRQAMPEERPSHYAS